jgi:hypothetical protein
MLEAWLDVHRSIRWFLLRGKIQDREPPLTAQGQKVVRVDQGQEVFELFGSGRATVRRKIEGHGGNRHPVRGSLDPTAKGSFAERVITIAGSHGPLQGLTHTAVDRL